MWEGPVENTHKGEGGVATGNPTLQVVLQNFTTIEQMSGMNHLTACRTTAKSCRLSWNSCSTDLNGGGMECSSDVDFAGSEAFSTCSKSGLHGCVSPQVDTPTLSTSTHSSIPATGTASCQSPCFVAPPPPHPPKVKRFHQFLQEAENTGLKY